jgi:hypothetical protein
MNSTIKSLLTLSVFCLALPAVNAMEKDYSEKKAGKGFTHKSWKKTKKYAGKAYDKAKEHPYATGAAVLGTAGLAGAALYKKNTRVKKAVDNAYKSMKKRTLSLYESEKKKGALPFALKATAAAALGYGAYKLNQRYTLWDKAKGYASDAWVNTKAFFGKEESLWEQFNQLTTGKKVAIAAGAAAGAGLVGWLGWKAYSAYTKSSANELEKCLQKFEKSLTPKQLAYATENSLLEKAKTDPVWLLSDTDFYDGLSKGQQLRVSDLCVLNKTVQAA